MCHFDISFDELRWMFIGDDFEHQEETVMKKCPICQIDFESEAKMHYHFQTSHEG